MAEYIAREAAVSSIMQKERHNFLTDYFPDEEYAFNDGLVVAANALDEVPAADVVPVRHGRWTDMGDFISCSLCSATRMKEFLCDYGVARRLDVRTNYCPNCGALMDKEGDGDVV